MLIGNVGGDPIIKDKFVSFNIATTEKWKDKNGDKQEKTEWHNCIVFHDGLQRVVKEYVKKGGKLFVEGKMHYSEKEGVKYASVLVTEIILL